MFGFQRENREHFEEWDEVTSEICLVGVCCICYRFVLLGGRYGKCEEPLSRLSFGGRESSKQRQVHHVFLDDHWEHTWVGPPSEDKCTIKLKRPKASG
jgi:hypothetical protein